MLAGAAALISTQIGQLAGWPRLLADSCRICIPGFNKKFSWKWQFRMFLLFFVVMPKMLSTEAAKVLKPNWIFAVGLVIAFLVFAYFCIIQMPSVIFKQ